MSNPLNKYCSEANDLKDVKDAMNKIQKLRAQMKNPTRDGMIEALRDAKMSALIVLFLDTNNSLCPLTIKCFFM